MRPAENINDLIKKLKLKASSDLDKRVHDDISKALAESEKTESAVTQPNIGRTIMKSPITKIAAAAVIIIAVAISVTILDKSVTPAYAIEQTIEANRGLWFIHLKCEPSTKGHVDEIWAQFDDNRQLTNLSMNFLDTEDGPKDVVWHEGKAEVWFKAKKRIAVLREKDMLAKLKMSYEFFDPKRIVEEIYQAQGSKNVQIKIQEPSAEGAPITITMTKKDSHDFQTVYKVDPETKLLQQSENYKLIDGEYKSLGRIRYLGYNNPADSEIFILKPPADVIRIDQTTREVGLEQGNLTDEEVAEEVVRKFFEALIAENYAGAGQFFGGAPADFIQKTFGHLKFLRIISIGPVGPHPDPQTGGLVVPCTVEIEHDGETAEWKLETIGVREVYNQPRLWSIFGGI
jgi:hypothetical protein